MLQAARRERLASGDGEDGGDERIPLAWHENTRTLMMIKPGAQIPINAYHFCMLADTSRNSAYRRAIEAAVTRMGACRVLDIGAGVSGVASRTHAVSIEPCAPSHAAWRRLPCQAAMTHSEARHVLCAVSVASLPTRDRPACFLSSRSGRAPAASIA